MRSKKPKKIKEMVENTEAVVLTEVKNWVKRCALGACGRKGCKRAREHTKANQSGQACRHAGC